MERMVSAMGSEVIVCGSTVFSDEVGRRFAQGHIGVKRYESGGSCREAMREHPQDALVLIDPQLEDVTPINLVGALRSDERPDGPHPRIILFTDEEVSGSLSSRARVAGADEVMHLPAYVLGAKTGPSHSGNITLQQDALLDELIEEPDVSASTPRPSLLVDAGLSQDVSPAIAPEALWAEHDDGGGFTIVVASGSGGVGKSTVSLLSAMELADRGLRCALVDLDLQFGDIAYLLGLMEYRTIDECLTLFSSGCAPDVSITSFATGIQSGVDLFACPRKPESGDMVLPHIRGIIRLLRLSYEVIVVNTGSFWSDVHVEIMRQSDLCMLLMNQRISSVQSCVRAFELIGCLGVPRVRTACLLNRFDSRGTVTSTDASMALRGATVHTVADGGNEVEELMGVGCPEELFALRNSCTVDIARMLDASLEPFGLLEGRQTHRRLIPEVKRVGGFENARGH